MLVDLKDSRFVLIKDQFAGALVLNRNWGTTINDVRVYHGGAQLKPEQDYFVFTDETAVLEAAESAEISLDEGNARITTRGSDVLNYMSEHGQA